MKRKLSISIATIVLLLISLLSFNVYADDGETITDPIPPALVDISDAKLTLGISRYIYDGTEKTPSTKLVLNGVVLEKDKDYSVTYSKNKNIGYASCTVNGIGDYTGSVSKQFKISPPQVKNVKQISAGVNSVTVQWDKVAGGVTAYRIYRYNPNTDELKFIKTVKSNVTQYEVKKLNAGTIYHIYVRAVKTVDDINFVGDYCKLLKVTTRPDQVTITSISKSGSKATIKWKSSNCSGYQIYYGKKSDLSDKKVITINDKSKKSYTFKNLNSKSVYYFKVRAFKKKNNSTYNGQFSKVGSSSYFNLYATYSCKYPNDANRINNLKVASKAINGKIIYPGQVFDFNDIVGPRTASRGYKPAGVIKSPTERGTELGGGICQVATTVFDCALYGNMEILERHQHSQRVAYCKLGCDAAIYQNVENLRFRNTSGYPIKIKMVVKDGKISCSFYTSAKLSKPKVELKVTQSGKNFTLKRYYNGKVNYTCRSYY